MAWNTVRLALYPPNRTSKAEPKSEPGIPTIIKNVPRPGSSQPLVYCDEVEVWAKENGFQGFEIGNKYTTYQNGTTRFEVFCEDETLLEAHVVFRLTRDSPDVIDSWCELLENVCESLDLSIGDDNNGCLMSSGEAHRLIRQSIHWQEFAEAYQWDLPNW